MESGNISDGSHKEIEREKKADNTLNHKVRYAFVSHYESRVPLNAHVRYNFRDRSPMA